MGLYDGRVYSQSRRNTTPYDALMEIRLRQILPGLKDWKNLATPYFYSLDDFLADCGEKYRGAVSLAGEEPGTMGVLAKRLQDLSVLREAKIHTEYDDVLKSFVFTPQAIVVYAPKYL